MNLFNKYRPKRFDEMVGQESSVYILKAQLKTNTTASTYLFSGGGGQGKTTAARLMAMSLLCEQESNDVEPCGICASCVDVAADRHHDVAEINCATNGGVDNVRDNIAARIKIRPSRGNYRIFILDEAHMLTREAQNALLKLTEEPPHYVKFFLATTETLKVLPTIRTRCQHFSFGRISDKSVLQLLNKVVQEEKMDAEKGALSLIVQASAGSARSALALLGQLQAVGITEESVRSILGRGPRKQSIDLIKAIVALNRGQVYSMVDAAAMQGQDLSALLTESARALMHLVQHKLESAPIEDPLLEQLSACFTGKTAGAQIVELAHQLLEIIKVIRPNDSADLTVQVGLLKMIDGFARLKTA